MNSWSDILVMTGTQLTVNTAKSKSESLNAVDGAVRRTMVLPFQPLTLSFNRVNYYVDMPTVS